MLGDVVFLTISIHAPREGCDGVYQRVYNSKGISIHAPREGCDDSVGAYLRLTNQFQSTHPARGATEAVIFHRLAFAISIHAPREGCDLQIVEHLTRMPMISIHAPREGCDASGSASRRGCRRFQSTHPARGATITRSLIVDILLFQSTHPARGATVLL